MSGAGLTVENAAPFERIPGALPCPFCGHYACFTEDVHGQWWGQWDARIWCSSSHCRAEMRLPAGRPGVKVRLVQQWNRRRPLAADARKPGGVQS